MWRAASAHSAPLLPTLPPARWIACSIVSQVSTPNNTGTFASNASCVIAQANGTVDVLIVRGFAADDGAETNDRLVAAHGGQTLSGERNLHRAGDPGDVDHLVGTPRSWSLATAAVEQLPRDRFVPAGDDDGRSDLWARGRRLR